MFNYSIKIADVAFIVAGLILIALVIFKDDPECECVIIGEAASATPAPTIAPTPAPTPVPTPTPVVYHGYEALVAQFFPENPVYWIGVFRCESADFREDVVNGPHVSQTEDRGLPQINEIHAWRYEEKGWNYYTMPRDINHDLTIAREIADEQGSQPWSCA